MSTVNLQPPRVPLTDPRTGEITREWYRFITDSFKRQGGAEALTNTDLEQLISTPQESNPSAILSNLDARIDSVEQTLLNINALAEQLQELRERLNDTEGLASYRDPFRVDWERPGKIGSLTPNTVRGTTLESTIATGTAPLIVASTTKVANLNVDQLDGADWATPAGIGTTTPNSGAFTTLTASAAVTLSPANAAVTLSPTGTGVVTIAPATVGTINRMNIGATVAGTGAFTTLFASGAFGCNNKSPQTPVALGAAATDLASVINLANLMRAALINNGIGS